MKNRNRGTSAHHHEARGFTSSFVWSSETCPFLIHLDISRPFLLWRSLLGVLETVSSQVPKSYCGSWHHETHCFVPTEFANSGDLDCAARTALQMRRPHRPESAGPKGWPSTRLTGGGGGQTDRSVCPECPTFLQRCLSWALCCPRQVGF